MKEKIYFVPEFKDAPGNPARCFVPTGRIEVNASIWPLLSKQEREFVLNHERGHRDLKTYNEVAADNYALSKMALKKPYSLKNHVRSVSSISHGDKERVYNAQKRALQIAAKDGSKEALLLLDSPFFSNADGSSARGSIVVVVAMLVTILFLVVWIKKH